jgi:NitT/TauT family transport system substrate-binding protein
LAPPKPELSGNSRLSASRADARSALVSGAARDTMPQNTDRLFPARAWASADRDPGEDQMRRATFALVGALVLALPQIGRAETLRIAVPQRGAWDTSFPVIGAQQGFFKEQGLDLEFTYTEGGASNEQAVISGSVDIAIQTGFLGIIAAYVKGAPVRIISPAATGAAEVYWYVKAGSPIKSLKDAHGKSVGFSNPGSSSNLILLQLLKEAGVGDAKLVPVGASPNGMPMVMTGQIDICYAVPPVGLKELQAKQIAMVARGNDSSVVRNETVRVNAANLDSLKTKRDAIVRFMRGYAKSADWIYSGEPAIEAYAKFSDNPVEIVRYMVKDFSSKEQIQIKEIKGFDRVLDEALAAKRISHPMKPEELKGLFDFVLQTNS